MNRGSSGVADGDLPGPRGFNEAPIHESGKSPYRNPTAIHGAVASMRPRFMNRGSRAAGCYRTAPSAGFNEAPIHESGKSGHVRALVSRPV